MATKGKQILIIDDEPEILDLLKDAFADMGHSPTLAASAQEAEVKLNQFDFDLVLSDIHMPKMNGLDFYEKLIRADKKLPPFIFVSGNGEPQIITRAVELGARDVVQKPFNMRELEAAVTKVFSAATDGLEELMDSVQKISGVRLGPKKRSLVETRLMRRARFLGLSALSEYIEYFNKNRRTEVDELVSVITTHTTEFFREPDHFDFLYESVLPELVKNKRVIRIWSAASSSGEEAYSLAISYFEFLRERGIAVERAPRLEVIGTDIDFNSVEWANNGIYSVADLRGINPTLRKAYFDFGSGEIAHLARVKEFVHKCCSFQHMNLISGQYNVGLFDIIFLRNVLIYFKAEDVKSIAINMGKHLNERGYLFLGHSESISSLDLDFKVVGNAVYSKGRAVRPALSIGQNSKSEIQPIATGTKLSPIAAGKLIRTMIIDDSASIRKMLRHILSAEHGFEVVAEAENPIEAQKLMAKAHPDVITLDIHMPAMDGVTYLKSLSKAPHAPVVMISSVSYEDGIEVLKCFELGAVDYIPKPQANELKHEADRIREVLRHAANRKDKKVFRHQQQKKLIYNGTKQANNLIVIGASTGGVEAITEVLKAFPPEIPPVVIVQHIPAGFSNAFAKRLNDCCPFTVKEAANGEEVKPNYVYIAPGGLQTRLERRGEKLFLEVNEDPPVNRHKPSVDYMFESVAKIAEEWTVAAALLTGMGKDGAIGLKQLRDSGVLTIAQDEETSVVFGMPKAAIDLGAAVEVHGLSSIAYHLLTAFKTEKVAS